MYGVVQVLKFGILPKLKMDTIKEAIQSLLRTTDELRKAHPPRKFTLDGRLVGDIGEVAAEHMYAIELFGKQEKHYDATFAGNTSKKVQIKATMKGSLTYPVDHTPQYYLGLKINSDGSVKPIFNGPGKVIQAYLDKNRSKPKTGLYSISTALLTDLDAQVADEDRVPIKA